MDKVGVATAWLETLIERYTDQAKAEPDEDAAYYVSVRVREDSVAVVRLSVHDKDIHLRAVTEVGSGVEPTNALLVRLNALNRDSTAVSYVWAEGSVWAQGRHPGLTMDPPEYAALVEGVAYGAAYALEALAPDFPMNSGLFPWQPEAAESDAVAAESDTTVPAVTPRITARRLLRSARRASLRVANSPLLKPGSESLEADDLESDQQQAA